MPKKINPVELKQIRDTIMAMPDGASVSDLVAHPDIALNRRTLQRRLESLLTTGEITYAGEGRGRRYYSQNAAPLFMKPMLEKEPFMTLHDQHAEYVTDKIPLSAASMELKARITRPLSERPSVGYQAEFQRSYIPNQTYYLEEATRQELSALGALGTAGSAQMPAGTYLRHILGRLLIDLSWNSSRLEGNTYSLLETKKLLELGVTAEGRNTLEAQMILNHKAAIEMLSEQSQEIGFNAYTICNLHAMLADNLIGNSYACGRIREHAVGIGASSYRPLAVPQQLEEHFNMILAKADAILDPLEACFFVLVHLPYLQPFEDVNKRTSRLAANIPLVMKNLCPLSFTEVNREDYLNATLAIYELNRIEYLRDIFIWAYRKSCQQYSSLLNQISEPDPFKFKYRELVKATVKGIVQQGIAKQEAETAALAKAKDMIATENHQLFLSLVMNELENLHQGNIMRYQLRPSEFEAWRKAPE